MTVSGTLKTLGVELPGYTLPPPEIDPSGITVDHPPLGLDAASLRLWCSRATTADECTFTKNGGHGAIPSRARLCTWTPDTQQCTLRTLHLGTEEIDRLDNIGADILLTPACHLTPPLSFLGLGSTDCDGGTSFTGCATAELQATDRFGTTNFGAPVQPARQWRPADVDNCSSTVRIGTELFCDCTTTAPPTTPAPTLSPTPPPTPCSSFNSSSACQPPCTWTNGSCTLGTTSTATTTTTSTTTTATTTTSGNYHCTAVESPGSSQPIAWREHSNQYVGVAGLNITTHSTITQSLAECEAWIAMTFLANSSSPPTGVTAVWFSMQQPRTVSEDTLNRCFYVPEVTSPDGCLARGGAAYSLCNDTGIHYCCNYVCIGRENCTSNGQLHECACTPNTAPGAHMATLITTHISVFKTLDTITPPSVEPLAIPGSDEALVGSAPGLSSPYRPLRLIKQSADMFKITLGVELTTPVAFNATAVLSYLDDAGERHVREHHHVTCAVLALLDAPHAYAINPNITMFDKLRPHLDSFQYNEPGFTSAGEEDYLCAINDDDGENSVTFLSNDAASGSEYIRLNEFIEITDLAANNGVNITDEAQCTARITPDLERYFYLGWRTCVPGWLSGVDIAYNLFDANSNDTNDQTAFADLNGTRFDCTELENVCTGSSNAYQSGLCQFFFVQTPNQKSCPGDPVCNPEYVSSDQKQLGLFVISNFKQAFGQTTANLDENTPYRGASWQDTNPQWYQGEYSPNPPMWTKFSSSDSPKHCPILPDAKWTNPQTGPCPGCGLEVQLVAQDNSNPFFVDLTNFNTKWTWVGPSQTGSNQYNASSEFKKVLNKYYPTTSNLTDWIKNEACGGDFPDIGIKPAYTPCWIVETFKSTLVDTHVRFTGPQTTPDGTDCATIDTNNGAYTCPIGCCIGSTGQTNCTLTMYNAPGLKIDGTRNCANRVVIHSTTPGSCINDNNSFAPCETINAQYTSCGGDSNGPASINDNSDQRLDITMLPGIAKYTVFGTIQTQFQPQSPLLVVWGGQNGSVKLFNPTLFQINGGQNCTGSGLNQTQNCTTSLLRGCPRFIPPPAYQLDWSNPDGRTPTTPRGAQQIQCTGTEPACGGFCSLRMPNHGLKTPTCVAMAPIASPTIRSFNHETITWINTLESQPFTGGCSTTQKYVKVADDTQLCVPAPERITGDVQLPSLSTVCAPIATRIKLSTDTRLNKSTATDEIAKLSDKCHHIDLSAKNSVENFRQRLRDHLLFTTRTPPCDRLLAMETAELQTLITTLRLGLNEPTDVEEALSTLPDYLNQVVSGECDPSTVANTLEPILMNAGDNTTIIRNVGYQTTAFQSSMWAWIGFRENLGAPNPFQWSSDDGATPVAVTADSALPASLKNTLMVRGNPKAECTVPDPGSGSSTGAVCTTMIDRKMIVPCGSTRAPSPPPPSTPDGEAVSSRGPLPTWGCSKPIHTFLYPDWSPNNYFEGETYTAYPYNLFRTDAWTSDVASKLGLGTVTGLQKWYAETTATNADYELTTSTLTRSLGATALHLCDWYGGSATQSADQFNANGKPTFFNFRGGKSTEASNTELLKSLCSVHKPWYNYVFTPMASLTLPDLCPWVANPHAPRTCLVFFDHPIYPTIRAILRARIGNETFNNVNFLYSPVGHNVFRRFYWNIRRYSTLLSNYIAAQATPDQFDASMISDDSAPPLQKQLFKPFERIQNTLVKNQLYALMGIQSAAGSVSAPVCSSSASAMSIQAVTIISVALEYMKDNDGNYTLPIQCVPPGSRLPPPPPVPCVY